MDIDGPQNRAKRRMESVLRHLSKSQKGEHNHSVPTDTKSCVFKSSCAGAVNPAGDIEDIGGSFLGRKHSADYGDASGTLVFTGCAIICILRPSIIKYVYV